MRKQPLDDVLGHWSKLIENFQTSTHDFYASVEWALLQRKIPDLKVKTIVWNEGGVLSPRREYLRMTDGRVAFDLCAAPFGTGFFFSWWLVRKPASWVFAWALLFAAMAWLLRSGIHAGFVLLYNASSDPFVWSLLAWEPSFMSRFLRGTSVVLELLSWGPAVLLVCAAVALAARVGRVAAESALLAIPFFGWIYRSLFAPDTYYRLDTAIMLRSAVHAAVLEAIEGVTVQKGLRALSEEDRKPIMRELVSKELLPMGVAAGN